MQDHKAKLKQILDKIGNRHVDTRLLAAFALLAIALIGVSLWLSIADTSGRRAASRAAEEGQRALESFSGVIASIEKVLHDEQALVLAEAAIADPARKGELLQHLTGQLSDIKDVMLFGPDLSAFDPVAAGPNGYALLDMLLNAEAGLDPPLQVHSALDPPMMVDIAPIQRGDAKVGYFAVMIDPEYVLSRFNPDISESSYINLSQNNGRQPPTVLKQRGAPERADEVPERLLVGGTLFRIELPRANYSEFLSAGFLSTALILGILMLAASVFLYRKSKEWALANPKPEKPPEPIKLFAKTPFLKKTEPRSAVIPPEEPEPASPPPPVVKVAPPEEVKQPEASVPPPLRMRYDLKQKQMGKVVDGESVPLTREIFRAYDIRGVVGQTLDAGVAEQVGRVLGTLALEKNAGPMVVARDGRLSGPALMEGMIAGITSSGCPVLNIGAVPTGVLYFAAHELAKGSGVMITGSHNPPDYNGFKVMIAGDTLFGPQIADIHRRIQEGSHRTGTAEATTLDVLGQYRDRIARDIKLERPLRVVIDCGNGIGGVCAADVLRAIGAEVLPLFDEVDGTFPNHHPDPSDPENMKDLIESVLLMNADLGLALDGDADRLGVVTHGGSIIYPDRVMMLLAMDVLDRVPGATIIYDVKCTGHLARIIESAGGKAVMYKTGHSLIKARMKEIGSPFAGEMSGHFFFGERWYGVDDGIYAAARLLEILAGSANPPEAILNALPTSFSTPELKVQMKEGENHAFIEEFQLKARFEGAKVSTIDGLRADFPDGWGLVRASNTTPILVVRFDAETEEALERIKNVFRAQMLAVNRDLELPF